VADGFRASRAVLLIVSRQELDQNQPVGLLKPWFIELEDLSQVEALFRPYGGRRFWAMSPSVVILQQSCLLLLMTKLQQPPHFSQQ